MRKTSLVLISALMAFGFIALTPMTTAHAGCSACKIYPNYNAPDTWYPKNPSIDRSYYIDCNPNCAYDCDQACQYCTNEGCNVCIDIFGCACGDFGYVTCHGVKHPYYLC